MIYVEEFIILVGCIIVAGGIIAGIVWHETKNQKKKGR